MYKDAGVNPLAGCLPTLATIPVFIGLYNALSNAAKAGLLTDGFFWIPSLSGPTTIVSGAAAAAVAGLGWCVQQGVGKGEFGCDDVGRRAWPPLVQCWPNGGSGSSSASSSSGGGCLGHSSRGCANGAAGVVRGGGRGASSGPC